MNGPLDHTAPQLIAIDATALREMHNEMRSLRAEVRAALNPHMTVKQFAAHRGVTTRTVNNWIAAGKLKTAKINDERLIDSNQAIG
jgi:hypothetical protein